MPPIPLLLIRITQLIGCLVGLAFVVFGLYQMSLTDSSITKLIDLLLIGLGAWIGLVSVLIGKIAERH